MLNQKVKIWRFLFWQLFAIFSLIMVSGFIDGKTAIKACFMGGMVVMLPQIVFVSLFFKRSGARAAKQVVNAFYLGEAIKICLTGSLFWFVLAKTNTNLKWFFIAFFGAYSAYVWVPLYLEKDI